MGKFYIVYETINSINNMKYIGVHSTNDLNDGYLGSGKALLRAVKKYGRNAFHRKTLVICESESYAYDLERKLVNKEFISRRDNYNLVEGGGNPPTGSGENNNFFGKTHSKEVIDRLKKNNRGELNPNYGLTRSLETKKKQSMAATGRKKSTAHKKKISESILGRRHVTNGVETRCVKGEDLELLISQGWKFGRK